MDTTRALLAALLPLGAGCASQRAGPFADVVVAEARLLDVQTSLLGVVVGLTQFDGTLQVVEPDGEVTEAPVHLIGWHTLALGFTFDFFPKTVELELPADEDILGDDLFRTYRGTVFGGTALVGVVKHQLKNRSEVVFAMSDITVGGGVDMGFEKVKMRLEDVDSWADDTGDVD